MIVKRFIFVGLLIILIAGAKSTSSTAGPPPETLVPTAVLDLLRQSGGLMTPTVRSGYVDWAKKRVLEQLSPARLAASQDVLREIDSDSTLSDAIYASVYPPDKSILQNYLDLRSSLGSSFDKKYRALTIAAAVAHRTNGLSKRNLSVDVIPDPQDLEVDTPSPEPDLPTKEGLLAGLPRAIADFMKSANCTALAIYEQPALQQQLSDFLQAHDIKEKTISSLEKPRVLGKALKSAMVDLGQRPAKRQEPPDVATWLQYLVTVYESSPNLPNGPDRGPTHWPLFPMAKAPWPLLMPLSRPMPLEEARYIYQKLEGEHGADRYHTYGPYRKADAQLRAELQPSTWHWDAWPDRIVHGGVCIVMSQIAIDTHRALCQPALPAAQPHHSNLISFGCEDEKWSAHVDQAFAGGPPETHSMWMFNDVNDGPIRQVKVGDAGRNITWASLPR